MQLHEELSPKDFARDQIYISTQVYGNARAKIAAAVDAQSRPKRGEAQSVNQVFVGNGYPVKPEEDLQPSAYSRPYTALPRLTYAVRTSAEDALTGITSVDRGPKIEQPVGNQSFPFFIRDPNLSFLQNKGRNS